MLEGGAHAERIIGFEERGVDARFAFGEGGEEEGAVGEGFGAGRAERDVEEAALAAGEGRDGERIWKLIERAQEDVRGVVGGKR